MKILSGLVQGQVLQRLGSRGATAILHGTSADNGPVRATLSHAKASLRGWKKREVGRAVRGKFSVTLSGLPAGGPYRLTLEAGAEKIDVSPFFVGDVWILAGQSNMEGLGDMTGAAKPHPLIRAFSMRREWRPAQDPLHILMESSDPCHTLIQCSSKVGEQLRRKAVKGVGAGLFFAREMLRRSKGVPQGLICAAHGGTSMQQWNPQRKHLRGESLYASMLTSVRATGQPVSGILWYQGESDANPADAALYTPRMKKLVAASRRDLRQPRLPWIIVQLGRFFTDQGASLAWNQIQEQQRRLPDKIKFLETVPAIDLPMDDSIHIGAAGFPRLAARLAAAADRLVYRNSLDTRMLQLRGVREVDQPPLYAAEVTFDFVRGGLRAAGQPVGFGLLSTEGAPLDLIYKTELKGNVVKLHIARKLIGGFTLFHGYGFASSCNITDARGFSLPVFACSVGNGKPRALAPFITQWKVSDVVPAPRKLDKIPFSHAEAVPSAVKTYPAGGFINERSLWEARSGHAFFHSRLHLSEAMKLDFLMGYDGPFRLWLNGKSFFTDMKGTNPCLPDESIQAVSLKAGMHDLHVGMDMNEGRAWGFFLRLARKDVTAEQIRTGDFVKPTYSV